MGEWEIISKVADQGGVVILAVVLVCVVLRVLKEVDARYYDMLKRDLEIRESQTAALTEMNILLRRINGRIDKLFE